MESRILARAETTLIVLMIVGFVLITQQWSFSLYQLGLLVVICATILNIAVSNVPKSARGWGILRGLLIILAVVAGVFALGIWLVPYLAQLGQ